MVRSQAGTYSIEVLLPMLCLLKMVGGVLEQTIGGSNIVIATDENGETFQRGDDQSGIWSKPGQRKFIRSILKNYPVGIFTFVKAQGNRAHQPWMILDGANRIRALRDYRNGRFDVDGKRYNDLTEREKARFDTRLIPYEQVTIERNDPPDTITDMFINLNTTGDKLSQGELIKARGWLRQYVIIEAAKQFVNWGEYSNGMENLPINSCLRRGNLFQRVTEAKEDWESVFGPVARQKRCDSMAFMCGYQISAITSNFSKFDKRYTKLASSFDVARFDDNADSGETKDVAPTELTFVGQDPWPIIATFVDVVRDIIDYSGVDCISELVAFKKRVSNGIPSKNAVGPIWWCVLKEFDAGTSCTRDRLVEFYAGLNQNAEQWKRYKERVGKGEITPTKVVDALLFIANDEFGHESDDD